MKKRHVKFSPWRLKYLEGSGLMGCFICDALREEPDAGNLVLVKTNLTAVMINRYPYNNGHLMIVPKQHESTLQNLDKPTLTEMMTWVQTAESILGKVYKPNGFNVGVNIGSAAGAGLDSHIHIHILPRWSGDTNFMGTVSDVRVVPEELESTWYRLVDLFKTAKESVSP